MKAQRISQPKKRFQDILDDLFTETGKKIVRSENEIRFSLMGETLAPISCRAARSRCWSSC